MDDTPQDRPCTANDFFWRDLPGAIGAQFDVASHGFTDGMGFGVDLLFNNDVACYGDNAAFWVEYGLGVVVTSAALLLSGGASLEATAPAVAAKGVIPFAEDNAAHIFRSAIGHLAEDTAANRAVIQSAVDSGVLVKSTAEGVQTFRLLLPDGTQAWADVFGGETRNGGVNLIPRGP